MFGSTCRGLGRDGSPGQSGSGEKNIVALLPQFEDPAQHNALAAKRQTRREHVRPHRVGTLTVMQQGD